MGLTNDEKTLLMIAVTGQAMIPIGRWEKPLKALVKRGLMKPYPHPGDPTGHFNNYITDAGREAIEADEKEEFAGLIEVAGGFRRMHHQITAQAEKISRDLVTLSRASAELAGDPPHKALEKWSRVILERALAVLMERSDA